MIKARLLLSISHSYIEDCLDGFFCGYCHIRRRYVRVIEEV